LQALIADQVHAVEGGVQNFQAAQVAMVVEEVGEEASRHLGAFRATATRNFRHRGIQTVGRELAVLLDHSFHAVAFGAIDQGIFQLLRIDARGVLTEQRHDVIRGDHVFHHALVFQQAHPLIQAFLLRMSFGRVLRGSGTH